MFDNKEKSADKTMEDVKTVNLKELKGIIESLEDGVILSVDLNGESDDGE